MVAHSRLAQQSKMAASKHRRLGEPSASAVVDEAALGAGLQQLLAGAEGPRGVLARSGLRSGSDEHGGTGLYAARDLPSGYELRVPRRFVLDAHAASRTALGRALQTAGFSSEDRLLAVLACARLEASGASGTTGAYSQWAATLPLSAPDAANWPPSAKQTLAGTDLGAALPLVEQELGELHRRLVLFGKSSSSGSGGGGSSAGSACAKLGLAELRWARGMALSRRFPAFSHGDREFEGEEEVCGRWGTIGSLIPVMDLLNHSANADPAAITMTIEPHEPHGSHGGEDGDGSHGGGDGDEEDGEYVVLRNRMALKVGDEAFTNYGCEKSNEELLASYGFACKHNPADRVQLMLSRPTSTPTPTASAGGSDGSEAGGAMAVFSIERGGEVPLELWRALGGNFEPLADDDDDDDDDDDRLMSELQQWVTPTAIAALRQALGAKLRAVYEQGQSAPSAGAGGGERGQQLQQQQLEQCVRWYREGVQEILLEALDMIDTMERMLLPALGADRGGVEGGTVGAASAASGSSSSSEEDSDDSDSD